MRYAIKLIDNTSTGTGKVIGHVHAFSQPGARNEAVKRGLIRDFQSFVIFPESEWKQSGREASEQAGSTDLDAFENIALGGSRR